MVNKQPDIFKAAPLGKADDVNALTSSAQLVSNKSTNYVNAKSCTCEKMAPREHSRGAEAASER